MHCRTGQDCQATATGHGAHRPYTGSRHDRADAVLFIDMDPHTGSHDYPFYVLPGHDPT